MRRGLTWDGVVWAFSQVHSATWHPLTWLSHMLDVQLFGMTPAGHHATNVALHVLATVVLYAALVRLTGAAGRSAAVAGLFALHPLRVESVAWVSERKDVLFGLFWMATCWAYAGWAARRGGAGRYALVVATTTLALLAKPMAVTLPFVLLLLDWWPLDRVRTRGTSGAAAREAAALRARRDRGAGHLPGAAERRRGGVARRRAARRPRGERPGRVRRVPAADASGPPDWRSSIPGR